MLVDTLDLQVDFPNTHHSYSKSLGGRMIGLNPKP